MKLVCHQIPEPEIVEVLDSIHRHMHRIPCVHLAAILQRTSDNVKANPLDLT